MEKAKPFWIRIILHTCDRPAAFLTNEGILAVQTVTQNNMDLSGLQIGLLCDCFVVTKCADNNKKESAMSGLKNGLIVFVMTK